MGSLRDKGLPSVPPECPVSPSMAMFCYCSLLTFYPKYTGCFSRWGLFLNHFCILSPWNRAWQREDAQYVWEGEGEGRREGGRIEGKKHHHIFSWSQAHTHMQLLLRKSWLKSDKFWKCMNTWAWVPCHQVPSQSKTRPQGHRSALRQRPRSHAGSVGIEGLLCRAPSLPNQPHPLSWTSERSHCMLRIHVL